MGHDSIELMPGAEDNGLACMLGDLIRDNLRERPHKRRDFCALGLAVAITARDAEVSLTLEFRHGRLRIHDGVLLAAAFEIIADSDLITDLSNVEIRFGFPWVLDANGLKMGKNLWAGRLRIANLRGALCHALDLVRLTRLMSVNG